jgi:Flp pilus assembly protein TadG
MRSPGVVRSRERGVALAFVAVSLVAMLALGAMAVDLSMLMDARAEAQRAADATALAGADAYRDFPGRPEATDSVRSYALRVAGANTVYGKAVDTSGATAPVVQTFGWGTVTTVDYNELTIQTIRGLAPGEGDSNKVRVWVRPAEIPTFFARTLSLGLRAVETMATAHAAPDATDVDCMKPFLLPDIWFESNKTSQDNNPTNDFLDASAASKDGGEQWFYEPTAGDTYTRYGSVPEGTPCSGYGCGRMGYESDWGTPMMIKPQQGNAQRQGNWYFTLDGPEINLREQIKSGCMEAGVGEVPEAEQGGKTGQVTQGTNYLINQDPGAHWDEASKTIVGSDPKFGGFKNSPRTITVGLFDPKYLVGVSGKNEKIPPGVVYDNFVKVWLEQVDKNENIMVRFLGFAEGGGSGPPGSIVLRLQLIQ